MSPPLFSCIVFAANITYSYCFFCRRIIITPCNCARGKVIGSVVVVVVVRVDTNFGISQHQGTCAACKRHLGVATGGKHLPTK